MGLLNLYSGWRKQNRTKATTICRQAVVIFREDVQNESTSYKALPSTTQPWFPWHRNQYRRRRSEKAFWKKAEVVGGSIWKETCREMPCGVSLKGNKTAQWRWGGGRRASTEEERSSFKQEAPEMLRCLPTRWAKAYKQMGLHLSLWQLHVNSTKIRALSDCVNKIIGVCSCTSTFMRQDYI